MPERRSPLIAGVLGFLFGPIGLGLYFRNIKDTWMPWVVSVLLIVGVPALGLLPAWIFCAVYGFLRVQYSNEKLLAAQRAEVLTLRALVDQAQTPMIDVFESVRVDAPPVPLLEVTPIVPPAPVAEPAAAVPPRADPPKKRGRPKGPSKKAA